MRRCRQHRREAGKPHNRPRSPRSRTCYPGTIRRRSASGVSVLVSIWWATRARVARRWREQYDAESGASRQTTSDHPVGADRGIVKLRLTAVSDPQHGGFTAGSSPVSWGSLDELFVNYDSTAGRPPGDREDRAALEALYDATGGPGWTDSTKLWPGAWASKKIGLKPA